MKIKVCGMRNIENITAIAALSIDYMGFIFYEKSPRFVNEKINISLPKKVKKVGVFVNEKVENIVNKIIDFDLDVVQLHGNETNDFINSLKKSKKNFPLQIFKAISIAAKSDFEKINDYPDADFLLLDTKTTQYGGSGQKFNWEWLNEVYFPNPFFLSGGISLEDIPTIKKLKINNLYGLDLNSKFETEPAIKDVEKVEQFISSM